MKDVYLGEVDFTKCKTRKDKESAIIRLRGEKGVLEMDFDTFLQMKGEFYFRNLGHYYKYFYTNLVERGMLVKQKINMKLAKPDLKANEFNFLCIPKASGKVVSWLFLKDKKIYSYKALSPKDWNDEDFDGLYHKMIKNYSEGLRGSSFSSAGNKFLMKNGKGGVKDKHNRWNDDLMVSGFENDKSFPVLTSDYQGKEGRIGRSTLGAINRAADSLPFDYEGVSHTIDVVSMYTSFLRNNPIPYGRPRVVDFQEYINYRDGKSLFLIRFSFKVAYTKSLAWRGEENPINKSIEYNSKMRMKELTMWQDEFEEFYKDYEIEGLEIVEVLQFRTVVNYFTEALDALFARKKTSFAAKMMLNGAAGKFSQDPTMKRIFDVPEYQEIRENVIETSHSSTYLALFSYLLSCGRVKLVRTIKKLGVENFLYSDTDSITFKGEIPEWLKLGKEIGYWDLESRNSYFQYLKPKTYMKATEKGDVFKMAGISTETSDKITREEFFLGSCLDDYIWDLGEVVPRLSKVKKFIGGDEYRYKDDEYYQYHREHYMDLAESMGLHIAEEYRKTVCPELIFDF